MTEPRYFFDTYALIEIMQGNPSYSKYLNSRIIITQLNLFELFCSTKRDVNETYADSIVDEYSQYCILFNNKIIKEAAKMKMNYSKQRLSMADCIGYCTAKLHGIKFLTGDMQFEHFEGVEFVK